MPVRPTTNDDTGIKVLYHDYQGKDPDMDPNKDKTIDILAVHGLGPHPDDTWTAKRVTADGSRWINWLQEEDMLPAEVPYARIMRHGYRSAWFGTEAVRQTVSSAATQLLMALKRKRRFCLKRPLIFLAHSFGGLVVLKALCDAYDDSERWPEVFESTKGLIFLGTPFRGAGGMEQSVMIEAAYRQLAQMDVEQRPLDILQPGNEMLRDLVGRFSRYWSKYKDDPIACFYELQASEIGKIVGGQRYKSFVVNEEAGCLDLGNKIHKYPLARSHFDMNKFALPTEDDYQAVIDVVMEMYAHRGYAPTDSHSEPRESESSSVPSSEISPTQLPEEPDPPLPLSQTLGMARIRYWSLPHIWDSVSLVTFSPTAPLVAIATGNDIRLWDIKGRYEMHWLRGHNKPVTFMAFSTNGTQLASGSNDHTLRLWDVSTGLEAKRLEVEHVGLTHIQRSPNGSLVASINSFAGFRLCDVVGDQFLTFGEYQALAFSAYIAVFALATAQGEVKICEVNTNYQSLSIKGHTDRISSMAFSPCDYLLATGSFDGTVRLWNFDTGLEVHRFDIASGWETTVAFSPDGSLLAYSGYGKRIAMHDVSTGILVRLLKPRIGEIRSIVFSLDQSFLVATSSTDKMVWKIKPLI